MSTSMPLDGDEKQALPLSVTHQNNDPPNDLHSLQATVEHLQRELREARHREEERDRREQARLRDLRRSTRYVPSFGTPAPVVTSLTDPFVSRLHSSPPGDPHRQRSLESALRAADHAAARQGDDDSDNDEDQQEHYTHERHTPSTLPAAQRQAIISKALMKIPSPGGFSGKDDKDKV